MDGAAVGVAEVHRVAQGLDGVGVVVLRGGLVLIGLFPIVQGRLGGGGIGGQEIVERVAFGEGDDGGGVGFERAAVFAKIFLLEQPNYLNDRFLCKRSSEKLVDNAV